MAPSRTWTSWEDGTSPLSYVVGVARTQTASYASCYSCGVSNSPVECESCARSSRSATPVRHTSPQTRSQAFPHRPLYRTASGSWRALSSGTPVAPSSAFSYITRALRQTAPYVLGSLRLLAGSYAPAELNRVGFSLYADLRPDVQGWGGRAEVRCATILGLRNPDVKKEDGETHLGNVQDIVKTEPVVDAEREGEGEVAKPGSEEPPNKKQHITSEDEYEAALDDPIFDAAELDFAAIP